MAATLEQPTDLTAPYCPRCGRVIEGRFCWGCGMPFDAKEPTAARAPRGEDGSVSLSLTVTRLGPGALVAGRYRIIDKLGQGGMGIVYRALDQQRDGLIALKLLFPGAGDQLSRSLRFRREFRAASRLTHPNIVSVFDLGQAGGVLFYSMELVEGESLRAHFKDRGTPVSPEALHHAIDIFRQICQALAFIHAHGIFHRDLKPDNIFIDMAGQIKIMDFGLARLDDTVTDLTQPGRILGSASYLAPEIALGEEVDGRTDLYSMGVLLYEILAGRKPFIADKIPALIFKHLRDEPVPPHVHNPQLPEALEVLVLALLAKNPRRRPASATDAQRQLALVQETLEAEVTAAPDIATAGLTAAGATPEKQSRTAAEEATLAASAPAAGAAPPPATTPVLIEEDRASALFEPELVGRASHVGAVEDYLGKLEGGEAGVFFFVGPGGVGRTRLLREAARRARLRGFKVMEAAFHEGAGTTFGAFADILERLAAELARLSPAQVLAITGDYGRLLVDAFPAFAQLQVLADAEPLPPLRREAERLRLFYVVSQLLANVALQGPLLLILDDLEQASDPAVQLFAMIARRMQALQASGKKTRLGILAACKADASKDSGTEDAILKTIREENPNAVFLSLDNLDTAELADMLQSMLGQASRPASFAQHISERTQGNPLAVVELMRTLREEGLLFRQDAMWLVRESVPDDRIVMPRSAAEYRNVDMPSTYEEAIDRKLSLLGPGARALVRAAAVIGETFQFDLVQKVLGADRDPLLDLLDEVLRLRLVAEANPEGTRYRFLHTQVRDALLAGLDKDELTGIHRKIGAAIETVAAGHLEEYYPFLAEHYFRGKVFDRALLFARLAGERLQALHANEEAYRFFKLARDMASEQLPGPNGGAARRLLEILGSIGSLATTLGKLREAVDTYDELLERARALQAPAFEAEAMAQLGELYRFLGDHEQSKTFLDSALALLEKSGDRRGMIPVLRSRGGVCFYLGELPEANRCFRKALTIAQEQQDVASETEIKSNIALVYSVEGSYQKAEELCRRSLAKAERIGHHGGVAQALRILGGILCDQGRIEEGAAALERSLSLSQQLGGSRDVAIAMLCLGDARAYQGRQSEAYALGSEALALYRRTGSQRGQAVSLMSLADLDLAAGRLPASDGKLWAAMQLLERANDHEQEVHLALSRGQMLLVRGDFGGAWTSLEQALARATQIGELPMVGKIRLFLGLLLIATGRGDEADPAFRDVLRDAQRMKCHPLRVHALEALSLYYLVCGGDTDRALACLQRAGRIAKTFGQDCSLLWRIRLWQTVVAAWRSPAALRWGRFVECSNRLRQQGETLASLCAQTFLAVTCCERIPEPHRSRLLERLQLDQLLEELQERRILPAAAACAFVLASKEHVTVEGSAGRSTEISVEWLGFAPRESRTSPLQVLTEALVAMEASIVVAARSGFRATPIVQRAMSKLSIDEASIHSLVAPLAEQLRRFLQQQTQSS
ncbi:MAG: tetratricopeptide repeat protein [Candidatus Schekmanbacteria bacterium]|nr:tetratricopeptide repeat protein [Candidatus Schekmanbacteria bacterium]